MPAPGSLLKASAASDQQHGETKRTRPQAAGQEAGREGRGGCALNPEDKKKLTAAGVGWEEYEDAGEWRGAGATRNKEKMRLLGREHKGTTRSAKQRGDSEWDYRNR